ncbi:hypothetical protein BJ944DRAFT_172479, partial [Cunninghamella echinulata]
IRQVLFRNDQCQVFRWKDETWYAVDGQCLLEVRQTFSNRSCIAIRVQKSGELYLNAWILPQTQIRMASATDISLGVVMGPRHETYLIHFEKTTEATEFNQILQQMHHTAILQAQQQSSSNGTLRHSPPTELRDIMQCKCKLFSQNEHSNWSSFGSVQLIVSLQIPSQRMHIQILHDKKRGFMSATVYSNNVERLNAKRITFLLVNERERTESMVYMVQVREEDAGNALYDYLKIKNAQNGW